MGTITHTLTITHHARDLLTPWIPAVGALASAAVAIVALGIGARQNKATRAIAKEQVRISERQVGISADQNNRLAETNERNTAVAEANAETAKRQAQTASTKLRIDLFDQRYAAWREVDRIADEWRNAIQLAQPVDITGLKEARYRLYFLFGGDVDMNADALLDKIFSYQRAEEKIRKFDIDIQEGRAVDAESYDKTLHVLSDSLGCSKLFQDRLRDAVRSYIRLHEIR